MSDDKKTINRTYSHDDDFIKSTTTGNSLFFHCMTGVYIALTIMYLVLAITGYLGFLSTVILAVPSVVCIFFLRIDRKNKRKHPYWHVNQACWHILFTPLYADRLLITLYKYVHFLIPKTVLVGFATLMDAMRSNIFIPLSIYIFIFPVMLLVFGDRKRKQDTHWTFMIATQVVLIVLYVLFLMFIVPDESR